MNQKKFSTVRKAHKKLNHRNLMKKIFSSIPVPDDARFKIRKILQDGADEARKKRALEELISILKYDVYIVFPDRVKLIDEIIYDSDRAANLAVETCRGLSYIFNQNENDKSNLDEFIIHGPPECPLDIPEALEIAKKLRDKDNSLFTINSNSDQGFEH